MLEWQVPKIMKKERETKKILCVDIYITVKLAKYIEQSLTQDHTVGNILGLCTIHITVKIK